MYRIVTAQSCKDHHMYSQTLHRHNTLFNAPTDSTKMNEATVAHAARGHTLIRQDIVGKDAVIQLAPRPVREAIASL